MLLGWHRPAPIPLFETAENAPTISWKLLWMAIVVAFVIANAPPKRISPLIVGMLQAVPETWVADLIDGRDMKVVADLVVMPLVASIKKFLFALSLIVIGYPIIGALGRSGLFWKRLGLKRLALSAAVMFLLLSTMTLPYAIGPYGLPPKQSGLAGLGFWFGEMSLAPFSFDVDVYYGRLLKPALAHYTHLSGYARYHLFSLACTYLLIFLTLTFLESKLPIGRTSVERRGGLQGPLARWVVYFSVMTSSFIMVSFQEPGKVDDLAFIFILLMVSLPMTAQARLGLLACSLLTHESIALTLVPAIVFWFPKEEKLKALLVIGVFFVVMAGSYGFNPSHVLEGHGAVLKKGSVWKVVMEHPGYFLAGLFFTYKLWWAVLIYVLRRLWARNQVADLTALAIATCFPILLCLLAWDTTRIAGVGFLGMLMALVLFMKEGARFSPVQFRILLVAVVLNLMIPSYQIILDPPVGDGPPVYMNTHSTYPYLGLYRQIHSLIYGLFN
jgi:hypothetical protein